MVNFLFDATPMLTGVQYSSTDDDHDIDCSPVSPLTRGKPHKPPASPSGKVPPSPVYDVLDALAALPPSPRSTVVVCHTMCHAHVPLMVAQKHEISPRRRSNAALPPRSRSSQTGSTVVRCAVPAPISMWAHHHHPQTPSLRPIIPITEDRVMDMSPAVSRCVVPNAAPGDTY